MRILTLIENTTSNKKLRHEHGLSFYVEFGGKKILIDTGSSDRFIKNAARMRVNLKELDAAIISHNHYDHTGGLESLFKLSPDIKVFAKRDVAGDYYLKLGLFNFTVCWNKHFINRRRKNFVLFNQFQEVCEGFYVMGCEVDDDKYVLRDKRLLKRENGRYAPDDFKHEIFAVAFPKKDREKGCVVISSCSHSGIVNILRTVRETWVNSPILGVVGGFHLNLPARLMPLDTGAFMKNVAEQISELSAGCVYTCHCTGKKAYERLKERMGDQIQYLRTGEELVF
ncbi:MAG: MBL fold metallo-hydrolase [Oscillospiraceae bacterium]|jgi:7,8-dihydropterin-6-yl-methyl-4-(beta-D-ribofuranosyl)aminobenzene 5'-phosphate synthase|nr:MBL fold metallo-hydrolase [Oscillospiraceae bacterium]